MARYNLRAFNSLISNGGLDGKNLPKRIKILDWGKNETTDGDVYLNEKTVKTFAEYQKKTGRDVDVALDFDHCSVPGAKEYVAGQPKAIAAYGDPELIEGDGLYLNDLEWTPLGEQDARNYKDLSPAVVTDREGTVVGLHSAALTPNGAIYKLQFYSTQGFDNMIKQTSTLSNDTAAIKAEYNKWPGNEGIKELSQEDTKHDELCVCSKCVNAKVKEFAQEDDAEKLSTIKSKSEDETKTKTMSAEDVTKKASFPDAYISQQPQYNTMNDTIIKKLAAEIAEKTGVEKSATERVLFAFLADYEGKLSEIKGQITTKENTEEGGLKQFSATLESLKKEIETLKNEKNQEVKKATAFERQTLVGNASKEGKVIPLSANEIENVDINILRSIVEKQPKHIVPMTSTLRTLSVDASNKPSRDKAVSAFNEMLKAA